MTNKTKHLAPVIYHTTMAGMIYSLRHAIFKSEYHANNISPEILLSIMSRVESVIEGSLRACVVDSIYFNRGYDERNV